MRRFFGFFKGVPRHLRDHWRQLYDSTRRKMRRGASHIVEIIRLPRKDNWRRKEQKKRQDKS